MAEDVSEPVHESPVGELPQEPTADEADPGALVSEPSVTEPASENFPEDSTPEPSVTETVPEALVSESGERTGEEATLEAPVTEASVDEEPPAPVVESGKPDTSAWRPGDVFMLKQMKDLLIV